MLTKLLKSNFYRFARNLKLKKPPLPPNLKLEQNTQKIIPAQPKKQSKPQNIPLNSLQKAKDKKLANQIKQLVRKGVPEQQILQKYLQKVSQMGNDYEISENLSNLSEELHDPLITKKIAQDIFLNDLMQQKKSADKQLPIGQSYRDKLSTEEQMQIRQQKIIKKIRQQKKAGKDLQYVQGDKSGMDFDKIDYMDRLESRYSPEIIHKAKIQKQSQLIYFKQLIGIDNNKSDDNPDKKDLLSKRLKKNQHMSDVLQRQISEKQQKQRKRQEKQEIQKYLQENQISLTPQEKSMWNNQKLPTRYEDQNYYRQKAIHQFSKRESDFSQEDKKIIEAAKQDLQSSIRLRNLSMQEIDDLKYDTDYKKQIYQASSFGKQAKRIQQLHGKLVKHGFDIDIQDIKRMDKSMLFNEKKFREQQLQYQKYQMKKQKKKQMDELISKIHQQKLRDDLDYDKNYKERYSDIKYDPLNIEENLQKVKQMNLQKKALLLPNDKRSEIHFIKTERKMKNFIIGFFHDNLFNANSTTNQQIKIMQLFFNEKKTVIHVFWKFKYQVNAKQQPQLDDIRRIHRKLSKVAPYASGKMTQLLGLRYGPDIRFHHDKMLDSTKQIIGELSRFKIEIIEQELKSLKKKGLINDKQTQRSYRKKLEAIACQNLQNFNSRKVLLSKSFLKKQKKQMNTTKERPQRKGNRKKKKDPQSNIDQFWDSLNN